MNIIGVKYIGKKDYQIDSVCNTDATWTEGQIVNFDEVSANKLLVHADSFIAADMQKGQDIFSETVNYVKPDDNLEKLGHFDLNKMDIEQLEVFAMRNFGKRIDKNLGLDAARSEVQGLVRLDSIHSNVSKVENKNGVKVDKFTITFEVTKPEYEAYEQGIYEPKLVAKVENKKVKEEPVIDPKLAEVSQPLVVTKDAEKELPTLEALLNSLDKKELQEFARQNKVKYANTMNEKQLRIKLLRELAPEVKAD